MREIETTPSNFLTLFKKEKEKEKNERGKRMTERYRDDRGRDPVFFVKVNFWSYKRKHLTQSNWMPLKKTGWSITLISSVKINSSTIQVLIKEK